jgi:hypothetical protein
MKRNSVLVGNARSRKGVLVRNDAKVKPKLKPVAETQSFTFNFLPKQARLETLEEREYTVVPMVILTEGVHNGSNGSLYYPPEELSKTPESWDHKPIVVYHPELNGQGISACQPDVINNRKVGIMMNTKWDKKNHRLKSEAWIEASRANKVDERVMNAITENVVMEVSTGVNIDLEDAEGEWNGEEYNAIARNYRPDHLAILPDQIGACSIKDGAGLLRNQAAKTDKTGKLSKKVLALLKELGIATNEMSYSNLQDALSTTVREKLDIGDTGPWCYVVDVYSNFFIYEYDGKTFMLGYTANETGVTLSEDAPVEVNRVTEYRTVTGAYVGNRDQSTKDKTMKLTKEQRKLKIDGLIANKESGWSEEDRQVLDAMKDNQLVALAKGSEEEPDADPATTTNATATTTPPAKPAPAVAPTGVTTNATPATPALFDYTKWLNEAPPQLREMITNGQDSLNTEKAGLIKTITANKNNQFSEDSLKTKPLGELRALAALAAPAVDPNAPQNMPGYFGGMAPTANVTSDTEEALELPVMNFEAPEKTAK